MIPRHIPGAIKTATYEYSNLYYYRGTGSPVIDLFVRAHVRDNKRRNGVMITRIKAEISLSSSPNPLPSSKRVVGERLIFIRPRPHHGTRYLSRTTTTSGLQGSSSAVQTPQARLQLPSLGVRARVPNGLEFHPFPRTFQVSSLSASLEGDETTVEARGRGDSSILWLSWHSSSALTGYLFKLRLFNAIFGSKGGYSRKLTF